jgi:DNA-binding transcriptional LysR family regulator
MNERAEMELRQLRYFVEITDQGSFSRAAETLAIAQPALTTQVQKLEAEFAAQLFIRSKRGVALTEVGRVVYDQARRTLDEADATMRAARLAADPANARLVAGYTRVFPFLSIAATLRRLRRERPNVRVDLLELPSEEQMDALISGALDVGFVHYTVEHEDRALVTVPAAEESLNAVVYDGHPFAARRQVTLAELADDDFIMPAPAQSDTLRERTTAACRRAGFEPRVVQEASDFRLLLGLVSAGIGVALASSVSRNVRIHGIHYLSIVPRHIIRYATMYRAGPTGRAIAPYLPRLETVTPPSDGVVEF